MVVVVKRYDRAAAARAERVIMPRRSRPRRACVPRGLDSAWRGMVVRTDHRQKATIASMRPERVGRILDRRVALYAPPPTRCVTPSALLHSGLPFSVSLPRTSAHKRFGSPD